jgi:hypothetical protein
VVTHITITWPIWSCIFVIMHKLLTVPPVCIMTISTVVQIRRWESDTCDLVFFDWTESTTDSTNCLPCITYTSCLLLSNTLHDAAFCRKERWTSTGTDGGAADSGVRQTSSVPDNQPQHTDCCEDSRYLSSLSAFDENLQFTNSVKDWRIPPRHGPYRKICFDVHSDEKYACMADIGWITGHSYIVYGPLANGVTMTVFELMGILT